LSRIDQALKRLADDEYGECLECGKPIAQKRLAFDPSNASCLVTYSRRRYVSKGAGR
jgi:DnaK suppressor protein